MVPRGLPVIPEVRQQEDLLLAEPPPSSLTLSTHPGSMWTRIKNVFTFASLFQPTTSSSSAASGRKGTGKNNIILNDLDLDISAVEIGSSSRNPPKVFPLNQLPSELIQYTLNFLTTTDLTVEPEEVKFACIQSAVKHLIIHRALLSNVCKQWCQRLAEEDESDAHSWLRSLLIRPPPLSSTSKSRSREGERDDDHDADEEDEGENGTEVNLPWLIVALPSLIHAHYKQREEVCKILAMIFDSNPPAEVTAASAVIAKFFWSCLQASDGGNNSKSIVQAVALGEALLRDPHGKVAMSPLMLRLIHFILKSVHATDDDRQAFYTRGSKPMMIHSQPGEGGGGEEGKEVEEEEDPHLNIWGSNPNTLRKKCASLLDFAAEELGSDFIVPLSMPTIEAKIRSKQPYEREAGLLALGAMAVSCGGAFAPQSSHILDMVIKNLKDKDEMIRCVAYWSLGRLAEGLFVSGDSGLDVNELFTTLLVHFKKGMGDPSSTKVQSAAASALADVIEELPYTTLMDNRDRLSELGVYWVGKTPYLPGPYDLLGTLAEVLPPEDPPTMQYIEEIMPLLLNQWEGTRPRDNTQAYPAETIVTLLREANKQILEKYLPQCLTCAQRAIEANLDMPTKLRTKVLEASLNIVCSVLDLWNAKGLFEQAPWVMQAIFSLMTRPDLPHGISTSVHALLGEAIRLQPNLFLPTFSDWGPLLTKGILSTTSDSPVNARNNAAWAIGRVALIAPVGALDPWADDLAKVMSKIILKLPPPRGDRDEGDEEREEDRDARCDCQYLRITCACSLGALGINAPQAIANRLRRQNNNNNNSRGSREGGDLLAQRWCQLLVRGPQVMEALMTRDELFYALLGLTTVIRHDTVRLCLTKQQQSSDDSSRVPPAPTAGGNHANTMASLSLFEGWVKVLVSIEWAFRSTGGPNQQQQETAAIAIAVPPPLPSSRSSLSSSSSSSSIESEDFQRLVHRLKDEVQGVFDNLKHQAINDALPHHHTVAIADSSFKLSIITTTSNEIGALKGGRVEDASCLMSVNCLLARTNQTHLRCLRTHFNI